MSYSLRALAASGDLELVEQHPERERGDVDPELLRHYGPLNWPTREDYLDLNFKAIVATCRSVLNTSSPVRSFKHCGLHDLKHYG